MVAIKKEGVLLQKTTLEFENDGVLNPAVIIDVDCVHLFFRAVSKVNYSSIGYCKLKGPFTIEARNDLPVLFPQYDYESHGLEDPRIVKIENLYYLTYTAYDGVNALGALAVSKDLHHFEKMGLIVPKISYEEFNKLTGSSVTINEKYLRFNQPWGSDIKEGKQIYLWDKNVIFFPRRINGKLHFLHRVKPDIQLVAINNLEELTNEFWENYFLNFDEHIVLTSKYDHEVCYIGGGCPPIETEQGWLLIYHGVQDSVTGYIYSACAALFELENPSKEIARLPYPLFSPEHDWEQVGVVNNVCFPTGTVILGDMLYIYYGAADEQIACASVSLFSLLKELMLYANKNE